jgi:pyruvate dehydrogenase E1 component alpha subunit
MIADNGLTRYERLFRSALRIRLVEERIIEVYPSDRIQSPVHLSIGQEAVAVGICEPMKTTDLLFSTYRTHALYMAKGGDLPQMFAELYGRLTGVSQGKAGSMHLAAPAVGMMGSSAVVASTLPHAAGAALASRRRGLDQIVACIFGDGATEEGVYHETLNFIALHKLPVLLVCENNGLAVHSPISDRQSYSITDHVGVYGIASSVVPDGRDFETVADTIGVAVDAMRKDGQPKFIEISTCRYKEHVGIGEDFDAGYRSEERVLEWQSGDPLIQDHDLIERFTPALTEEIDAAIAFAEASPFPGREHLLEDTI